jgi:phage shock protein C
MEESKKLYRSTSDKMIAGVCGGLAKYFNMDPTLMRVIFVALALIGGPGVILYIILWIFVQEEPAAA